MQARTTVKCVCSWPVVCTKIVFFPEKYAVLSYKFEFEKQQIDSVLVLMFQTISHLVGFYCLIQRQIEAHWSFIRYFQSGSNQIDIFFIGSTQSCGRKLFCCLSHQEVSELFLLFGARLDHVFSLTLHPAS